MSRGPRRFVRCLAATAGLPLALTVTSGTSHVSPSETGTTVPDLGCNPPAGTVLSAQPIAPTTAWMPTNIESGFQTGPATITRTYSSQSTVTAGISASFQVSEGLLFVSAQETYGISLSGSIAHSATWSYSSDIPRGVTGAVQQFHLSDELGITQSYITSTPLKPCGVGVETSPGGNYLPDSSDAENTYCYALVDTRSPGNEVARLCSNQL